MSRFTAVVAVVFLSVGFAASRTTTSPPMIIDPDIIIESDGSNLPNESDSYDYPDDVIITDDLTPIENGFLPTPPPPPETDENVFGFQSVRIFVEKPTRLLPMNVNRVNLRKNLRKKRFANNFKSPNSRTKVQKRASQRILGGKPEEIDTFSRGSYSYVPPDGVTITVNWVADENGFQATGDHLPTPPPMPEHRYKLLAVLRTAATR